MRSIRRSRSGAENELNVGIGGLEIVAGLVDFALRLSELHETDGLVLRLGIGFPHCTWMAWNAAMSFLLGAAHVRCFR